MATSLRREIAGASSSFNRPRLFAAEGGSVRVTGRLEGRAAIITGASRGLGRAMALAMAAEGAGVAVVGRTEQVWDERLPGSIGETVAAIEEAGGRAVAVRADLLLPADRSRLVEEARAALGPITILVNNAAFTAPGRPPKAGEAPRKPAAAAGEAAKQAPDKPIWPTVLTTPVSAYSRHFEMLFAAYELIRALAPQMAEASGGAIINITSEASRVPGEGPWPGRAQSALAGYGGSKAALEHLTWCAGFDLAPSRISVNALSPSKPIITPGLAYYKTAFEETSTEADFAEAAVALAALDPAWVTGRVLGHADVLDGSFRLYAP
jgi:NAD(P)-dependent dehydrogenase (short-subunit alcohol dehydrogenase family)